VSIEEELEIVKATFYGKIKLFENEEQNKPKKAKVADD